MYPVIKQALVLLRHPISLVEQHRMNTKILFENKVLEHLYSSKIKQLNKAISAGNKLRCLVLQAEADAICQELKHFSTSK